MSIEFGIHPPDQLFGVAAEVRRIIESLMVIEEPHAELEDTREQLKLIADRLGGLGRRGFQARMSATIEPGPDDMRPYYAGNARRWHYNPIFPPLRIEKIGGRFRAHVTLGLPYEGPPGCCHGGLVAMLLDQVLGQSNFENGLPAMTGTLSVKYRRPTPLLQELVVEADPPELADNRKCVTRGRILCGETVTAEAHGLFVLPNFADTSRLPMMHRERDPEPGKNPG